jgi:hypothetical protein
MTDLERTLQEQRDAAKHLLAPHDPRRTHELQLWLADAVLEELLIRAE